MKGGRGERGKEGRKGETFPPSLPSSPLFLPSFPPLPSLRYINTSLLFSHHFLTFSNSEALPNRLLYLWQETLATEEWKRKEHL